MIAYVIPCSGAKIDHAAQARDLYTGPMYRHTLKAAEAAAAGRSMILILSGKYGLLPLDLVIHPYDQQVGKKGSVTAETVASQASRLGIDESYFVKAMLPRHYLHLLLLALLPKGIVVEDLYEGCHGIGEQRHVNAEMIEDARRVYFGGLTWSTHRVIWGAHGRDRFIPVTEMVGRVLNVGTKDGLVYEAAMLTAFDDRTGVLVLEGGYYGSTWGDAGPKPLESRARVQAYDVARGYIHP